MLALHVNAETNITSTLSRGDQGDEVTALQQFLAGDSTIYPQGLVTGYYGSLTVAAVMRFQARYGISQTGTVGPLTMAQINSLGSIGGGISSSGGSTGDVYAPILSNINIQGPATTNSTNIPIGYNQVANYNSGIGTTPTGFSYLNSSLGSYFNPSTGYSYSPSTNTYTQNYTGQPVPAGYSQVSQTSSSPAGYTYYNSSTGMYYNPYTNYYFNPTNNSYTIGSATQNFAVPAGYNNVNSGSNIPNGFTYYNVTAGNYYNPYTGYYYSPSNGSYTANNTGTSYTVPSGYTQVTSMNANVPLGFSYYNPSAGNYFNPSTGYYYNSASNSFTSGSNTIPGSTVTVNWTTNEPATTKVYYSPQLPFLISSAQSVSNSTAMTNQHSISVPTFSQGTTYGTIESVDPSGNVSWTLQMPL